MRQDRFKLSELMPTVLSLLLVVLITAPCLTLAKEADDVYMHAVKGQSPAQQDWDKYECHCGALGQTRFGMSESLTQAAISTPIPTTLSQPRQRHVAKGAARGAALGAVGGAITGDAAKGAAAGAAMGGTAGAFRRRDVRKQQQQPIQPQ